MQCAKHSVRGTYNERFCLFSGVMEVGVCVWGGGGVGGWGWGSFVIQSNPRAGHAFGKVSERCPSRKCSVLVCHVLARSWHITHILIFRSL